MTSGDRVCASSSIYIAVLVTLLVACARDKEPAETAIKAAAQAIEQVRGEATLYAPDQLKQLDDSLKAAQDNFAKKEYKAALEAAGTDRESAGRCQSGGR
jgi:hypothetical protein